MLWYDAGGGFGSHDGKHKMNKEQAQSVLKQVEGKGQNALGDAKEIVDDAKKYRTREASRDARADPRINGVVRRAPSSAAYFFIPGFNTTFVHPSLRASTFLYASGAFSSGNSCETIHDGLTLSFSISRDRKRL